MTYRAKPVVKRSRSPFATEERRTFFLNLGFVLVIVLALSILVIRAVATWYDDHLGAVVTVDGTVVTKDEFNKRLDIEVFRFELAESRIQTDRAAGRLTEAQAAARASALQQQRTQIVSVVVEELVDSVLMERFAEEEGVTVTDADVQALLDKEATVPSQRHAWVIEVIPATTEGEYEPSPEAIAAARSRANEAVRELRLGTDWAEVVDEYSDGVTTAQDGDLGWITDTEEAIEPTFLAALFEVEVDAPTPVIEGEDGYFRIGRVTEAIGSDIDEIYVQRFLDRGITMEEFTRWLRPHAIREGLIAKFGGDLSQPVAQREVAGIYIAESATTPPAADAVKTRHILYSPNDDPGTASAVPLTDPAWEEAEDSARDAYDRLRADIGLFDSIARRESDEQLARTSGGKLQYFDEASPLDVAFKSAVLAPGLRDGQLLEPVRSSFGWHVIQIMHRPPAVAQLERLRGQAGRGVDFGSLARDYSDLESARNGGNLGWVARSEFDVSLSDVVFAIEVGELTEVVTLDDGAYLFKVLAEENRMATRAQAQAIQDRTFREWYTEKRIGVVIEYNESFLGTGTTP